MKKERHICADSFPLRPREKHGVVKAINKRCSNDLQAAADGYCKFWVYQQKYMKVPLVCQDKGYNKICCEGSFNVLKRKRDVSQKETGDICPG